MCKMIYDSNDIFKNALSTLCPKTHRDVTASKVDGMVWSIWLLHEMFELCCDRAYYRHWGHGCHF